MREEVEMAASSGAKVDELAEETYCWHAQAERCVSCVRRTLNHS
jgi:hypothetical protein